MDRNPKIRVCHIASGDLWAGAEVQIYNLVSALNERPEIEVSAILLNSGQLAQRLSKAGVRIKIIEEREYGFREIAHEADIWLRENPQDILHSHRFKENVLATMLKRRKLARYLVQTVHGLGEPLRGPKKIKAAVTGYLTAQFTRRHIDRVVAVSKDIQTQLAPSYGNDRVVVIRNSVAFADGNPDIERGAIRREFGLEPSELLVGTAGRLVPVKAYDDFLRAARIIADQVPTTRFLIAGDGPLRQELENLAGQLGLTARMIFTGFREDIQAILADLDLFVMSSLHEGIPVVLLEAMSLSRPVVVTAVGGMVEVVESDISGVTVPVSDPMKLARACQQLLADPGRRKSLGEAGAQRVSSMFTIQEQCRRTVELYQQLLPKR